MVGGLHAVAGQSVEAAMRTARQLDYPYSAHLLDSLATALETSHPDSAALLRYSECFRHYGADESERALAAVEQSNRLRERFDADNSSGRAKGYYMAGVLFYERFEERGMAEDLDSLVANYRRTVEIDDGPDNPRFANAATDLATVYLQYFQDEIRAKDLLERLIRRYPRIDEPDEDERYLYHTGLRTYVDLKVIRRSLGADSIKQIYRDLLQNFGTSDSEYFRSGLANTYLSYADYLDELEETKPALKNYWNAIDEYRRLDDIENRARAYNNLGFALLRSGNAAEAEQRIAQSHELEKGYYGVGTHPEYASYYDNMGDVFRQRGANERAVRSYQTAIRQIIPNFGEQPFVVPDTEQLQTAVRRDQLFNFMHDLARGYRDWGQSEQLKNADIAARETLFRTDELLDLIFRSQDSREARTIGRSATHDFYETAIEFCARREDWTGTLFFLEKSKALVLYDELSRREETLDDFPTGPELQQMADAQLPADGALLHAFYGHKNLYWFVRSEAGQQVIILPMNSGRDALLRSFNALVRKPREQLNDPAGYQQLAFRTFREFVEPALQALPATTRRLLVLPDGRLNELPLSALVTGTAGTEYGDFQYLLHDYEISYGYSLSVLRQQCVPNGAKVKQEMLALAPFAGGSTFAGLPDLPDSEAEMNWLEDHVRGTFLRNEAARKQTLLDNNRYGIIHFNTHAEYGGNAPVPRIFCADGPLHLDEINRTAQPVEMVVLAACQTARGDYWAGEGVLSLSRGFALTGARSAVSSQWRVNARSTSAIVRDFYENLLNGTEKSTALHRAKRSYLTAESTSAAEQAPYFWAAMTVNGNPAPIVFAQKSARAVWLWMGGILLPVLFFIVLLKRRRVR